MSKIVYDRGQIFIKDKKMALSIQAHLEYLFHYQCQHCNKWWSIAEITPLWGDNDRTIIYCPHCGTSHQVVAIVGHIESPKVTHIESPKVTHVDLPNKTEPF